MKQLFNLIFLFGVISVFGVSCSDDDDNNPGGGGLQAEVVPAVLFYLNFLNNLTLK